MHVIVGKLGIGPGGVKCACCLPCSKKAFKKLTNRYLRRKAKQHIEDL